MLKVSRRLPINDDKIDVCIPIFVINTKYMEKETSRINRESIAKIEQNLDTTF